MTTQPTAPTEAQQLINDLMDESDLCRQEGASDIADLIVRAIAALIAATQPAPDALADMLERVLDEAVTQYAFEDADGDDILNEARELLASHRKAKKPAPDADALAEAVRNADYVGKDSSGRYDLRIKESDWKVVAAYRAKGE